LVSENGLVVVHRRSGEEPPRDMGGLVLTDERGYGSAVLWRYEKENR
jgi:hypothetical protein